MKKLTVLTLTLALIAAMAVTTANAQETDADTDWEFVIESRVLIEDQPAIYDIAFLDDETLISVDEEGYIRARNVTTGAERWHIRDLDESVRTLAVPSHNPSFIALGTVDGEIHMIYSDGSGVREGDWFGQPPWHNGEISDLAFMPNSYILASAGRDTTVRIWDVADRNNMRHRLTLDGHTDEVNSVAWHPDNHLLASASYDETVRLWEIGNGTHIAKLRHIHPVLSVAWHPDGNSLVSGNRGANIDIWNTEHLGNITYVHTLVEHSFSVHVLAFSPDGQTLASASSNEFYYWSVNANTYTIEILRTSSPSYYFSEVVFSPNGQTLAYLTTKLSDEPAGRETSNIILHEFVSPGENGGETVGNGDEPGDRPTVEDGDEPAEDVPPVIDINALIREIANVNGDGYINKEDLVIVAENYGLPIFLGDGEEGGGYIDIKDPAADINKDGKVDVTDVLIMIAAIEAAAAAPALTPADIETGSLQASDVRQWIRDAKQANADPAGIAALERLLTSLNRRNLPVPKKTVLLANYPNPFNPETWIPYQLSETAEVTVTIHASDGKLVRTLELGQVPAGAYADKNRAAYWDGQNEQGEPVASGVYFYTLTAGEFSATRKMVIRK